MATQSVLLVRTDVAHGGIFSKEFHRHFISRHSVDSDLYSDIGGGIYGCWSGNFANPIATEGAFPIGGAGWWYVGEDAYENIILYNPDLHTWKIGNPIYGTPTPDWRMDERIHALIRELGPEVAASSTCTFEFVKVPAHAKVNLVLPYCQNGEPPDGDECVEWSLPLEQMVGEMAKMLAGIAVDNPHPYTTDLIRLRGNAPALRAELEALCA
jgi:hypothetical protein